MNNENVKRKDMDSFLSSLLLEISENESHLRSLTTSVIEFKTDLQKAQAGIFKDNDLLGTNVHSLIAGMEENLKIYEGYVIKAQENFDESLDFYSKVMQRSKL